MDAPSRCKSRSDYLATVVIFKRARARSLDALDLGPVLATAGAIVTIGA